AGGRRAFAAAPNESVLSPTIVSTIFPQLPRPSMATFRACLGLGLATVLVLGLARVYPVALVVGGTLAWGLATGTVTALIAKGLSPSGSEVFVGGHGSLVITRGVLIPVLSVALILLGPLAMLRYPRF